MLKRPPRFDPNRFESVLPWLMLALLGTFTYALFFQVPYAGLDFPVDGKLIQVYVPNPSGPALQAGDQLLQVGSLTWAEFRRNLWQTVFVGLQPGEVVPLVIERNGQRLPVDWTFPGPTLPEVSARLSSEWLLPYFFWLAGTITLLFLRPKDDRWRLFIAFNFLTAVWLAVGGTLSPRHIWGSALVFRSAVWLTWPVYWHLHWVFPAPLRRLPPWVWWLLYGVTLSLIGIDYLQWLPNNVYFFGLLLALLGSAGLLVAHWIFQPAQRRDIGLLAFVGLLIFAPVIAMLIVGAFIPFPPNAALVLLALPILPFGYLYVASRRQLGGLELRTNQLITAYIFFIALGSLMIPLVALADSWLNISGKATAIGIGAALVAAIVTRVTMARFQRFVERWLLGIRLPPIPLVEAYPARITVSLDTLRLIQLLTDEVLPSLLIRQSALLHLEEGHLRTVYEHEVAPGELPTVDELAKLLTQAGKYRGRTGEAPQPCDWVRLVLPLEIEQKTIGVWLLGRRDPDDFYSQAEIATLQALAHQTAIALTNITYAKRLHALYQTSIDQREIERASLGHELHDHILHQLFLLQQSAASCLDLPPFAQAYATVTRSLRDLIRGLRPPMLEYGLYEALVALADDWTQRSSNQPGPLISLEVPESDVRYVLHVEQHLYRIVQQAGENALRHARAQTLRLYGCLEPDRVELTIEDDGQGFDAQKRLDLNQPESRSHFGLIGMRERAALINAQIQFDSEPGQGTRVHFQWRPES